MARLIQVGEDPRNLSSGDNRRNEIIVPQRQYVHQDQHLYLPEDPITFPSRAGGVGITLTDAMFENFHYLIGRDDPLFTKAAHLFIELRLEVSFTVPGANVADSTRFLVAGL